MEDLIVCDGYHIETNNLGVYLILEVEGHELTLCAFRDSEVIFPRMTSVPSKVFDVFYEEVKKHKSWKG